MYAHSKETFASVLISSSQLSCQICRSSKAAISFSVLKRSIELAS